MQVRDSNRRHVTCCLTGFNSESRQQHRRREWHVNASKCQVSASKSGWRAVMTDQVTTAAGSSLLSQDRWTLHGGACQHFSRKCTKQQEQLKCVMFQYYRTVVLHWWSLRTHSFPSSWSRDLNLLRKNKNVTHFLSCLRNKLFKIIEMNCVSCKIEGNIFSIDIYWYACVFVY